MTLSGSVLIAGNDTQLLPALTSDLANIGYETVHAVDGAMVMNLLEKNHQIDVVVLDRAMEQLDGMEVLRRMKASNLLSHIPVIIQAQETPTEHLSELIGAGAYCCLRKPCEESILIGIIRAALTDKKRIQSAQNELRGASNQRPLMEQAVFRFRTLEDIKELAPLIAHCCPHPETVVVGLSELMINAVEHGNLGICYHTKTKLVANGEWQTEIERRLDYPDAQSRFAELSFVSGDDGITIVITDSGDGFDWKSYLEFDPNRITDPHGRGIAMAVAMSFSQVTYNDTGNVVTCHIRKEDVA